MRAFILLFTIILTSCTTITQQEYDAADYGDPLTKEQAQEIAISFLNRKLKDPESAKIEWRSFRKDGIKEKLLQGGRTLFGYKLIASINSKNSYGAYGGYKQFEFLIKNRSILTVYAEKTTHSYYGNTTGMVKVY